jgi:Asp-tRNA(Asn)/Glu-tRNA(Gln) amidotransferase A subunit family amidase
MTDITADIIAAAEALLGISYTPAERALMLDNLAPQIELALRRRALPFSPSDGPATKFDPRLPGFTFPHHEPSAWPPTDSDLPATDEDIAFAPIEHQAGWIKSQKISSVRLTEIYLDRIRTYNPQLFCYATVTPDSALRRAAELDVMTAKNIWLGPLHGIPYGLKDIFDTAGIETAWGAEPFQNRIPESDAHIVTSLHAAGAVMLGKTTVGALAYGDLWYGGRTRNPWNPNEGSSGSSAGSAAAAAAGLAGFCIGTETLGSIVSPATRCGAVGLRPTYGRISRAGAMPLCWSLDKIGPICRAVTDSALILAAINQSDPNDPFHICAPFTQRKPAATYRLGYFPADFTDPDTHELDHQALQAAKALGHDLVELHRPDRPYDALMAILFAEAAAAFEDLTLSNRDDQLTWQDSDAWPNSFRKARFLSAVDHVQADRLRRLIMQDMAHALTGLDAIIGPSLAGPMLTITNFTGHPCLCLPAGTFHAATRDPVSLVRNTAPPDPEAAQAEVPHSICLYGNLFDEATLIAIGQSLETAAPFGTKRPGI